MRSVAETPSEPIDYAALTAAYGSLLGAVMLAARNRRSAAEPLGAVELAATGAATFALAKLIVHEKVETWLRQPFVAEGPDGRHPRGTRLRYAVGELLTCTRCMGAWSALGLTALRTASPPAGRVMTNVLAASAMNDFLQAGFSWMCGRANRAEADPQPVARRTAA
jgi:hypothetical protein